MRAYDEMLDFIAAGPSSRDVVTFRASEEARSRVADLIRREKTDGLSSDEASEPGALPADGAPDAPGEGPGHALSNG